MQQIHLAILIHGLQGNPDNVAQAKAELIKHHESQQADLKNGNEEQALKLEVFVPKGISGVLTFDGIELGAVRIAEEVDAELARLRTDGKQVQAVSIMGYSLGGLMARYLVGLLESRSPSFFDEHKPASFSTIATPHIGMPRYGTRISTIQHLIGGHMFSRTGRELFCWDKFSDNDINHSGDERCLLEVMSDPNTVFMRALKRFKAVRIIANGCYDLTVPYPTAAITDFDPFDSFDRTGIEVEVDENQIVTSWRMPEGEDESSGLLSSNGNVSGRDENSLDGIVRQANAFAASNGNGNGQVIEKRGKSGKSKGLGRKRPRLPPPLQWRFPINIIIFTLLPVLIPIVIVFLTVTLVIARVKSQLRLRRHLSAPTRKAIAIDANGHANYNLDPNENPDDSDDSQSLLKRTPQSPTISDLPLHTKSVRLLLSDSQKRMIKNFNRGLPNAERVVAWFPSAYNSHATIIVRDPKRWPHVEEGRGILRDWAKFVNSTAALE